MCASKLNKLNEEENKTATISNFLHLFTFNILKTISLKSKGKLELKSKAKVMHL